MLMFWRPQCGCNGDGKVLMLKNVSLLLDDRIQAKASSSLLSPITATYYILYKHDFFLSDLILPTSCSLSQLILFCSQ